MIPPKGRFAFLALHVLLLRFRITDSAERLESIFGASVPDEAIERLCVPTD
jgi:hypothetical protein